MLPWPGDLGDQPKILADAIEICEDERLKAEVSRAKVSSKDLEDQTNNKTGSHRSR